VIHGNLTSPTFIRTPQKLSAFRCNATPHHRFRCRIVVFSHVASTLSLNFLNFMQSIHSTALLLHQLYAVVAHMTPFDLILHFFSLVLPSISVPNLKFLASTVPEILGWSQNSKSGSRDSHMTSFDAILQILDISPRFQSVCQV